MVEILGKAFQTSFGNRLWKSLIIFYCLVNFANARPYRYRHHHRTKKLLRNTLRVMKTNIDAALIEYIKSSMNCTSIHECRSQTIGLSLVFLPQFTKIEDVEDWNTVFRENLHSLRTFDFYVKEFVKVSEDTTLSLIAEDHLTDVSNLLHQFFIHFQSHMEIVNCYNMKPSETQPPLCVDCVQPNLPSQALEVTRNYLFLLQFHDFLNEFHKLYSNFFTYDSNLISNC